MTLASKLASQVSRDVLGISELQVSAILKQRGTGGYNDFGEWEEGGEVSTPLQVVYTPLDKTRDVLPEGLEDHNVVTIYAPVAVESLRAGRTDGDVFEIDGTDYRVFSIRRWGSHSALTAIEQTT